AAAADHKSSPEALDETFSLANISPQVGPGFNRDYWRRLESFVRSLSDTFEDVYVITGPLFVPKQRQSAAITATAGDGPAGGAEADWALEVPCIGRPPRFIHVPTHFFKVVVAMPRPEAAEAAATAPAAAAVPAAVAAFVLPNAPIDPAADLRGFVVPLQLLEEVAGLRFFASDAAFDDGARRALGAAAVA
ncbi:unnamed protein product, partial [Phaeothamnion confervicola]